MSIYGRIANDGGAWERQKKAYRKWKDECLRIAKEKGLKEEIVLRDSWDLYWYAEYLPEDAVNKYMEIFGYLQ